MYDHEFLRAYEHGTRSPEIRNRPILVEIGAVRQDIADLTSSSGDRQSIHVCMILLKKFASSND